MKLVHYKLRKEHQMQKYSTIIGVIELRQSGIGYRTTKKRYNIGNSTVTLIMNRFHELGLSLEELKAMPPKKVEEAFYPPENLRRAEKELPDFFQIHQRMMAMETRIKHHMGDVSIKMYDKFGCVLRIESTCNDISTFRVEREVQHRDGTSDIRKAPLKKSIYSLYQLFTILKSANYRYLEFISSFDDHSSGRKKLDDVSRSLKEKERSYRGFNFFDSRDLSVLEAISRGEYMTFGMQGKNIREHLPGVTPSAMTRIFKRLKVHGLIEKIPDTYKYLITSLGKEIIAAGLTIKNLILVPALTS